MSCTNGGRRPRLASLREERERQRFRSSYRQAARRREITDERRPASPYRSNTLASAHHELLPILRPEPRTPSVAPGGIRFHEICSPGNTAAASLIDYAGGRSIPFSRCRVTCA